MFCIAEFGSIVRESQDLHSDRDLLIVSELVHGHSCASMYRKKGYSVTLLSPRQIKCMQARGSLFIQHLKRESRIIVDDNSEFRRWLSACDFIVPTDHEIRKCISTIEFIGNWPFDPRIVGWQADFLYCASRDLLIKRLAKRGILAFGLEDLESAFTRRNKVEFDNFGALRQLRESKAAYRRTQASPFGTDAAIRIWLEELASKLPLNLCQKEDESPEDLVLRLGERSFTSSYELLRGLEVAYLVMVSHGIYHPDHDSLVKHIKNPNAYGSSQKRKEKQIKRYLAELISTVANKPPFLTRSGVSLQLA